MEHAFEDLRHVLLNQLTSTDGVFFLSGLVIVRHLEDAGIKVLKPAAFEPGMLKAETLREIRHSGFRVIIAMAFDSDIRNFAVMAGHEAMNQAGWAFVMTRNEIHAPVPSGMLGWLWTRPLVPSKGMQQFAQQVSNYTASSFNITVSADEVDIVFSAALFDAIMLFAHAATKVLSEGGGVHNGQAVSEAVRSTTFEGAGGVVALDENGDLIRSYEVMNYVVKGGGGIDSVSVGLYNITAQQYTAKKPVVWPGNTTETPLDCQSGYCSSSNCKDPKCDSARIVCQFHAK